MSHRHGGGRAITLVRFLLCAIGAWACLSSLATPARAQGSCDEASAKPTRACLELARARLDTYETRQPGLKLMRWICRKAGSKKAAVACLEYGDADKASFLWGGETRESVAAYERGCALGHTPSCAAYTLVRYIKRDRGPLDRSFWGKPPAKVSLESFATALLDMKAECEGGDARSCVSQGALLWLGMSDYGASLAGAKPGAGADKIAALALFERACDAGERLGCFEHASGLLTGDVEVPGALAGARRSYARACAGTNQRGCGDLADRLNEAGSGVSEKERLDRARRGCEQGHVADCGAWAALEKKKTPVTPLERMCELRPMDWTCALAARSYNDGKRGVSEKDPARALELARLGCSEDTPYEKGSNNYAYNCAVVMKHALDEGDYEVAITHQARSCKSGYERSCDRVMEIEVWRDTNLCMQGKRERACLEAASQAVSRLPGLKKTRDAKEYRAHRGDTIDLLGKIYRASCAKWKGKRECALSKVIARVVKFETARVACGLSPGPACDNVLGIYPDLLRAASAQGYDESLELLIEFDLSGWREMADARCAASSEAACYMRGMDHLGVLEVDATDEVKARGDFERGCKLGSGDACGMLAIQLHEGRGGPRDREGAREVAEAGCELGSKVSCKAQQQLEAALEVEREEAARAEEAARIERGRRLADLGQLERSAERARGEANAAGAFAVLAGAGVVVGLGSMVGGLVYTLVNADDYAEDEVPVVGIGLILGGGVLGAISGPALGGALSDADRADRRARSLESKRDAARRRVGPRALRIMPTLTPTRTRAGRALAPGISLSGRF